MGKNKSIILAIILILVFSITVSAASTGITEQKKIKQETLGGGVEYLKENFTTNAYNSSAVYSSEVQTLTLKPGTNVKLVPWSIPSMYATSKATLDKIAEDYEKNHPGYVVIGGINSEGYHDSSEYSEISNLFMQDGKLMRSGVSSESFKELIVINDDNSHFVKRFPDYSNHLIAECFDENGKSVNEVEVESVNKLPEGNGVSVFTKHLKDDVNIDGYYALYTNYITYRPKTFYISGCYSVSHKDDDIFVEGQNQGEYAEKTVTASNYNKVVYVTKSKEAYDKLVAASKIITQYHLLNEFADAKNIVGYMYKIIENGEVKNPDCYEDNSDDFEAGYTIGNDSFYYNDAYSVMNSKNRSCIGFKPDGSIVLTIAIQGSGGPNVYQLGNILKSYGVNEAYQFDGGGSVTMVVRNSYGGFDILNPGADGHPRSITTGVFFVAQEPKLDVTTSRFDVTFKTNDESVKDFSINFDNNTYKSENGIVKIDGLKEDSSYDYKATFNFTDGKKAYTTRTYSFNTNAFEIPVPKLTIKEIGKDYCIFTSNISLNNVYWVHDGISDSVGDGSEFKITDLEKSTEYNMHLVYDVKDEISSNLYPGEVYLKSFKTLEFINPEITKFEISKDDGTTLSIKYQIKDSDEIVSDVILHAGSNQMPLEELRGSVDIDTLLTTDDLYLEVMYINGSDLGSINSEVLHSVNDYGAPEPIKSGCNAGSIIISMLSGIAVMYVLTRKH